MKGVYFVSGIDTNIGKTVATGVLARQLIGQGLTVITQKLVQTGNQHESEDIRMHRHLMQVAAFPEDQQGLTAPNLLAYPASPHLASRLEQKRIDLVQTSWATQQLAARYDVVLLEGAGGLMVPLTDSILTVDYIAQHAYPVILVTSGRLGSINHTLLSFLALQHYALALHAVVFNGIDDAQDRQIANDTRQILKQQMQHHFKQAQWVELALQG